VEGQWLPFGSAGLSVMECPGHTPGGVCLLWARASGLSVFCGDLVFEDSYGRTDLPGGNAHQLRHSIIERLFSLPDDTVLYPGHGNPTTIGRERAHNPIKDLVIP
jgi:hydroxyacylglutathione hydrolase